MNFIIYHFGIFKVSFYKINYKMPTKFTCMPKKPVADQIFHFKNPNILVVVKSLTHHILQTQINK